MHKRKEKKRNACLYKRKKTKRTSNVYLSFVSFLCKHITLLLHLQLGFTRWQSQRIARFLPPFPLSICRVQNMQQTPQGHEGCQQEEEEEEKEEEGEGIRRRERIHQYNPMNATLTPQAQAQVCMN